MKRLLIPLILASALGADVQAQQFKTEVVASGLGRPHLVNFPPDGTDRMFVTEQGGKIHVIENGAVLATPYLDLAGQITSSGERGLLGMDFHPDYANNGWIFVNFTNLSGTTKVVRYTVDPGDPNKADPASAQEFLSISQPYSNHNGGMVAFGPDGNLYIGTGDGGSGGDPGNRAQSGTTLLGKMLRINVDQFPHTSPSDNIGVTTSGWLDEIWATGLRNPWRYTFDRETGDLWIADVGQNVWEEIDVVDPTIPPPNNTFYNFGWRLMEGNHCFNPSTNCNPNSDLVLPDYEYAHFAPGLPFRCSITGGNVYRGGTMARLHGYYFFADYCSGELMSLRGSPGNWVFENHQPQIGGLGAVVGFGEDRHGEIYVCSGGSLRKLVPDGFQMDVTELVAGQSATITVKAGTPNQPLYIAYSLAGTGSTQVPQLNIVSALQSPALLLATTASAIGGKTIVRTVPLAAQGQSIWMQAAQDLMTTNVIFQEID